MNKIPRHVAIIMDGNGRWATRQGKKRTEGHYAGYNRLKEVALHILSKGVKVLSVFAFSTENFKRSEEEVGYLMNLFIKGFTKDRHYFFDNNVKVVFSGRKEPLKDNVYKAMMELEEATKECDGGILNICLNYGGQAEMVNTCKKLCKLYKEDKIDIDSLNEEEMYKYLYNDLGSVDLMIRTSHELRTSNFLPWQLTYSEFYFPDKHWPEFGREDLIEAIKVYQKRNRRFGGRPDEVKK